MADNMRAKELAAKLEKLTKVMEAREIAAKTSKAETTARMNRFEATLESVTKAVDSLASSLECLRIPLVEKPPDTPPPYNPIHTRSVKLDFPRFDGSEPLYWIFRAEKFFAYYKMNDEERLTIAAVNMEGMMVPWFQMMQKNHQVDSWSALSKAIETEFGPSQFDSPRAKLFKLSQSSTAAEYYREFMVLANRVEGLTDEALLDCFISGLKPDLRRDVIAQGPKSLLRASSLAKLFDERSTLSFSSSTKPRPLAPPPTPAVPITTVPAVASSSKWPGKSTLPPYYRLPRSRRYIRLNDSRRQKCNSVEIKNYIDETEVSDTAPEGDHPDNNVGSELVSHHLSFNVLNGDLGIGTIRFVGTINGVELQVLLDGGSSDNFIQPRLVKSLKISVEATAPFKVLVGNGNFITGYGKVNQLEVLIQGHLLNVSAHVLPVTGADLVLGAAWLATLGPHIADYSTSTIKFFVNGEFITFTGTPRATASRAEFHHLCRMHSTHAIFECYTLHAQALDTESTVFQVPHGLPPHRDHDHHIILREHIGPVKVRPYRYPFAKKDAIEDIIAQMLHEDGFVWSEGASQAFDNLKVVVTTAPVLVLLDFAKPFVIDTDASGVGVGAVLSQNELPIAFFSKKISSRMQQWSAYAREMLAITETPEQEEWLPKLLGFQFAIEYKLGKTNVVVDALSRSFYMASSSPVYSILDDIRNALAKDEILTDIMTLCATNSQADRRYTVKDWLLYWKHRLVIPKVATDLQHQLLTEFHASPIGGHARVTRTYAHLTALCFWPTMWYTSAQVAEAFFHMVVKLHGVPTTILSDRDRVFTSSFWQHLFRLQGTSLHMSFAYHPQTGGQSEAVNKSLEMYLRCFIFDRPTSWFKCLGWAEYWYNTTFHTALDQLIKEISFCRNCVPTFRRLKPE
ncbi:Transposon Ty3-I Gag-Pol polyprotein [Senna tora]|uniref:Transposon Ty3-I Gag-Pol polyprotein n=1 Tax=Senna tora TaxID=362788 RepID=A0A834SEQ4_9FABA|nr:Transposon Ty3-I Gag-Pol polyprotein [Senna tora]